MRRFSSGIGFWSGLGLLAAACLGCVKRTGERGEREVVVVAKRIHTNDSAHPFATALVIRGERIAYVGDEAGARAFAASDAMIDRFPSATVVPGVADAHGHLLGLGRALSAANLEGMKSSSEVKDRLLRASAAAFQGDWLIGQGWDQNEWTDAAFPTKAILDAAMPGVAMVLTRVDSHAVWVSSAALERSSIGKDTPDPAGGRIVRDAQGEPTGVLIDNAIRLLRLPPLTVVQRERQLKLALETCAKLGLTAVHDAGMDRATFEVLQRWDVGGLLPIRVYAMADGTSDGWEEFVDRGPFSGGLLELRAVKFKLDGALGSRGAALHEPYSDDPQSTGLLLLSKEELSRRAHAFEARGFQVAVHAIGDRANTLVLEVLSTLKRDGRHRVEHAQILRGDDLSRFRELNVIASMQPSHATGDMKWAAARVGSHRLAFAYAWRAMLEAQVPLAFGSDFPAESPNPLWGLYAARTRQDMAGEPVGGWIPSQKISGSQALRAFTEGAAFASFAERRRGRLTEGFDADFVVFSVDPVDDEPKKLVDATALLTVVRGIDVFRANSP